MTKIELAKEVSRKLGFITPLQAQEVINVFTSTLSENMVNGHDVFIRGFGSFNIVTRKAKTGRLLSDNTPLHVPAKNILKFKPARELAARVKEGNPVN